VRSLGRPLAVGQGTRLRGIFLTEREQGVGKLGVGQLTREPAADEMRLPASPSAPLHLAFKHPKPAQYRLAIRRANDAQSAYLEMGSPKALTPEQIRKLEALTTDRPEQERMVRVDAKGAVDVEVPMRSNDVVLVTLEPARR
jgi:beta-xylosidase